MLEDRFSFLLPHKRSTLDQLAIFAQLKTAPMTVTLKQLQSIINVEESNGDSPRGIKGANYFYVRHFTLTTTESLRMCEAMADQDGQTYDEVRSWLETIRLHSKTVTADTDEFKAVLDQGRVYSITSPRASAASSIRCDRVLFQK